VGESGAFAGGGGGSSGCGFREERVGWGGFGVVRGSWVVEIGVVRVIRVIRVIRANRVAGVVRVVRLISNDRVAGWWGEGGLGGGRGIVVGLWGGRWCDWLT
jgi:hypothetical protein